MEDPNTGGTRAAQTGRAADSAADGSVETEIDNAIDELKATMAAWSRAGRRSMNISLVGMNSEQLELLPKVIAAGAKVGYLLIKKGITSFGEWAKKMRQSIGPVLREQGELSDREVDEWIEEMWNSDYPVDGTTRRVSEWAALMGQAKLRENVRMSLEQKRAAQAEAESVGVELCDAENIAATLPYLLPQQQVDVLRAEVQFFDPGHQDAEHGNGKGYMFTNGTGTGKTYTGLGIVKRFVKQGKGRILILTPSQTKVEDWINDGKNLGLDIRSLDDWGSEHGMPATQEKGEGVVITTYANFRQNKALMEDCFDLIVYDESHRLLENKKGEATAGVNMHYKLSNKDENHTFQRLRDVNPVYREMIATREEFADEYQRLVDNAKKATGESNIFHLEVNGYIPPVGTNEWSPATEARFPHIAGLRRKATELERRFTEEERPRLEAQAKEDMNRTKVVFLSATPFNTRENLDYAEGYIFSYPKDDGGGYAVPKGRSRFFLDHFGAGYKWRYHRLEHSAENAQALAQQEVEFSDWLQNDLRTMSGRMIDSEFDYSRDFPTVTGEYAGRFNEATAELSRNEFTRQAYGETIGNYNYGSALMESLKVAQVLPRIREHLSRGRKVVVFHRRVESGEPITQPFETIFSRAEALLSKESDKDKKREGFAEIRKLRRHYQDLLEWEKTLDLRMPREQLADAFGAEKIGFFSGKEGKKAKNKAVEDFNNDDSGKDIFVVQEASGKEGISLHDRSGRHQRVIITLALPQSPITALQIEGRIYRIGNKSNAIFEYPLLGLDSEMILFGQKFNTQVGTTENLALGGKARNLRESFARGIEERSGDVSLESQGLGGKEMDSGSGREEMSGYERAVLDYYGNQKLSGRRDSREGKDYYPTPEPLGYKMVEWGQVSEGESVLEPSAGHGAIARYVPGVNTLTAIEPSRSLFGRLQVKAGGVGRKFECCTFEEYNVVNKHDVVVMNPPFGAAGRMAVDHVAKAFTHLEEGGRIVAIIPRGSTDKKFEQWYNGEKKAVLTGEILLPDVTFERAGTAVNCRVVIIDKVSDKSLAQQAASNARHIDLSHRDYSKIEDFFEELEGIDMPARTIDMAAKMRKTSLPVARSLREIKGVKEVRVGTDYMLVSGRGVYERVDWSAEGGELGGRLQQKYNKFKSNEEWAESRGHEEQAEVYRELKKLCARLSGKTEEEMERGVKDDGVRFRMGDEVESQDNKKSPSKNRLDLTTPPADAEVTSSSSKGAAKLQKISENLNTLAAKYAGVTNHRGAITDFAMAIGADSQGYATIETANGDEIHIRISNHNANAGHFADKGHYDGNVSVVIKSRHTPKTFVANDDVELTEYIYTKEDISKDGNLLSQVAESLRQMLETGEYEDLSGKAIVNHSPDMENEAGGKTGNRYRMGDEAASFEERQAAAVANRGTVMPGLNEVTVRVVDVPRHDFAGKQPISQARRWAKDNIVGEHVLTDNKGDRVPYVISGRAIDKYLSFSAIGKSENLGVHLSVLKQLPEVIGESIEAEIHPDYNKGEDGVRRVENGYQRDNLIHRFYGAVTIDGKVYRVKTTLVEPSDSGSLIKPHSFEVTNIELLEESNSSEMEPTASQNESLTPVGVAKLLKGVEKSYDEGVKLLEASEKTSSRYRMGDEGESFEERQAAAVANRGTVMPGLNEATVRIVDVPRHGYEGHNILSQAVDAASKRYAGKVLTYDNYGMRFEYIVKPRSFKYAANHSGKSSNMGAQAAVMDKLLDVIGESIEVMEHADVNKIDGNRSEDNGYTPNTLMHRFVGAVNIDGTIYRVITTLKEYSDDELSRLHTYEVTKIEVLDAETPSTSNATTNNNISSLGIAKILQGAEIHNKSGEKILEESKKAGDISYAAAADAATQQQNEGGAEASELEQKGAEIAGRLNTPVRFVEDLSDITDSSADVRRKKRSAKGWYDTATGEVVIVLPNCDSVEDVEATIFHEVVGHKGLRELIGDERFGEFLRQVYEHASAATRAKINALMSRNGWNAELATEEYLAQLSERGFADMEAQERGFWSKVREKVLDFLSRLFEGRRLPKSLRLGDEELRYMLWRAYQKRVDGSLVGEAANVVMQERLGVGRFREQDREQRSVADRIENLFYEAVNGILTGKPVEVGRLTSEGKSYLERLSGMQLKEEVSFVLNPSDMVHIHNRHFGTNEKDGRNIPLTNEDIRAIASIVSNPDRVIYAKEKKGNERNLFFFLKENDSGSYNLLEVYADRKGNLTSKSFFKSKEGVSQRVISLQNDPTLYVHDGWGNPLDGAKLPKFFETAKESDESSRLRFRSGNYANAREEYEARVRTITERDKRSGEVLLDSGGNKKKANRAAMWHEAYLDSMASLKALQEAVENESGEELKDFENAYWAENRMSSSNSAQTAAWKKRYFEPLMREVSRLTGKGDEGYRNLLDYMMAKHGLERNAYMRTRAEANGEQTERDFAGLTSLFELSPRKWEEAEQRAEALVATYESAHSTAELWRLVNAATKATLQTRYDSGLISKDVYDKIRTQYQYYLPMKGWADTVAGDVYEYAAGTYHLGTALHSAFGRSSQADDPLATISVDAERTIMEANRNRMKMAFLNMAINHRTSLLTVRRQWYKKQTDGTWLEDDPPIPENATADEVNAIVEQHNADMEALKEKGEAYQSKKGLQLGMRVNKYERSQHIVTVSRAGEIYQVFINGNPRAAMAINGLLNPDTGETTRLKRCGQSVKNFMSKAFTTYNPEFIFSNLARDVMFAGAAVAVKEDKAYNSQYRKNISGLLVKGRILKLVHKYNAGTLDMDKDLERYFYEFMTNGGETGFTQVNTVDKVKKEMERFIRQAQGGASSVPGEAWRGLLDGVEFMNRCAEDATRFAVYMTSRQVGRGVARSVWDAKEITVNFNKKGSGALGARYLNFSYVFFNAAMQSLGNSGRLIKKHPGKSAMVMVAFMSAGFLLPLVSQVLCGLAGGDDDDYFNIPEWVRRNNLVIPIGKGRYLTIPIAHELRPFYGIGELAYSTLMGREDAGEAMYKAVEGFTGILPVDWTGNGGNVLISLTPTILQPLAQAYANVDYFGKPIYRRTASNTEDPEWTKAYRSTHPWLVDASRWLYEATATENTAERLEGVWYGDVNPAIVQHLIESYTGGMGKVINKMSRTISMLWDEEARELRNIPIASKFAQSVDERAIERRTNNEYYDLRGEYEKLQLDFRHVNAQPLDSVSGHAKKLTDWLDTPDGRRYLILRDYMKDVDYWHGVGKNAPTELMKERADSMENATKAELIETMRKPDEYPAETIGRRKQELDYDRVRQDKRVERQMKRAEGRMSKGNDKPSR